MKVKECLVVGLVLCSLLFTGCGPNPAYETLQEENEALRIENEGLKSKLDTIYETYNLVRKYTKPSSPPEKKQPYVPPTITEFKLTPAPDDTKVKPYENITPGDLLFPRMYVPSTPYVPPTITEFPKSTSGDPKVKPFSWTGVYDYSGGSTYSDPAPSSEWQITPPPPPPVLFPAPSVYTPTHSFQYTPPPVPSPPLWLE